MSSNVVVLSKALIVMPKIGLDVLRFGMTMEQVRGLWGQPNTIDYFIAIESNPENRDVVCIMRMVLI